MPCLGCGDNFYESLASLTEDRLFVAEGWSWRSVKGSVELSLSKKFERWMGTPYVPGGRIRGAGVDCVQFVASILDAMCRRPEPSSIPALPAASAYHRRGAGLPTIKAMLRAWPAYRVIDRVVEPGDVVVIAASRSATSPPGHVAVAGVRRFTVVHAMPGTGVTEASLLNGRPILAIYRLKEKDAWV